MVIAVVEVLSLMLFISDSAKKNEFNGQLARPPSGSAATGEGVIADMGDKREEVFVNVSPVSRSKKEIEDLLTRAKAEIDETILGKNSSPDEIYEDLMPQKEYSDGAVKAVWEFSDYGIINPSGALIRENIVEDTLLQADISLSCDGVENVYSLTFNILKPSTKTEAGFAYLLGKSLKDADEKTLDSEVLILPDQIDGKKVSWEAKESNRAIQLSLFGLACGVVLVLAGKEDKKRKKNLRLKKMEADYPEIVSMLSLYVGAGISVKGAFGRISDTYVSDDKNEDRPGFEGVGMLKRDMDDGKGELDAYRDFGKRMGHKDYRKLSILLTQNLRKGSTQLIDQLEKEEHAAFEERKIRAKIAGEEASTKLLLPMMGLLVIVMAVLIFPAMQGINI